MDFNNICLYCGEYLNTSDADEKFSNLHKLIPYESEAAKLPTTSDFTKGVLYRRSHSNCEICGEFALMSIAHIYNRSRDDQESNRLRHRSPWEVGVPSCTHIMKGNEPKYKLNGDSNLLHLCNKCHDEIDRLYPEDYSIERLLSFKFGSNLMAYVPSFNYSYLMTKCINRIASSLYKSRGRFYYSRAKTLYCRFMHRYDHRLSSEFEFKVSEIISKVWIGSPLMDDFTDEISIIMNKPIDLTLRLYQVRNSEAFLYFLRFHIINFTYRIEDPKNREFVKKRLNHAFLACVDILETLYICLGHDNYREFFKIPLKISLNTYSYEIFKSNIDSIRLSLHDDRLKLEDVWNLVYDEDLNAVDEPEKLLKS